MRLLACGPLTESGLFTGPPSATRIKVSVSKEAAPLENIEITTCLGYLTDSSVADFRGYVRIVCCGERLLVQIAGALHV